jgi:hypothetical protein
MTFSEKLSQEELLSGEKIILSSGSSIHINTEEYGISKPLDYLNPLYARMFDGRGWDNNILYIHGKIYLTNYRIVFKAKEHSFSLLEFPHDLGNSLKNRLHGKIDIFLWDISWVRRTKIGAFGISRCLDIYTLNEESYRFSLGMDNVLNFTEEVEAAKKDADKLDIQELFSSSNDTLILNERLEQHNKFWSGVGQVLGIVSLPLKAVNFVVDAPFHLLKLGELFRK